LVPSQSPGRTAFPTGPMGLPIPQAILLRTSRLCLQNKKSFNITWQQTCIDAADYGNVTIKQGRSSAVTWDLVCVGGFGCRPFCVPSSPSVLFVRGTYSMLQYTRCSRTRETTPSGSNEVQQRWSTESREHKYYSYKGRSPETPGKRCRSTTK